LHRIESAEDEPYRRARLSDWRPTEKKSKKGFTHEIGAILIKVDKQMDDVLKRREILIKKLRDDEDSFTSDDGIWLANLDAQIAIKAAEQWRAHEQ
jgi:hypothetical protein